ncbi:MAG: transcriptional regulator [Ignavibacteria bacterium RIFOXYB2_FULL_35_12]|nr:MAG: transcriptional regulator [Ignavibacteria bacterium GWA2_36_19]OGU62217.1 MAG: transcriptional regulator [Ignavibacteria bacterium GWF2_35_20]OGU82485.1 MAG: transcriptional regulator [Ignavibacteria bacterium RIFOXYA2_FULL_35_9]OGU84623.1 MAG: transcriptional regulator [Ignavibacteria bacterium RIFOXYA12_FULL_35_25]OGU96893.1 MAG: transcriptional regulator [Ignavibacteria bacterium RIFOXYB12_FULL_35_14]OGV00595.1 MAG: transcriptional regulator [Ignavibacteria bacterium RIFOXYC2_FULL_3
MFSRFDVYYVNLDPTIGGEIKKTRPCIIISPNEMNYNIATVIIAPLTSKLRNYPTRVPCKVDGKQGQVVLDQIRTVDKSRLMKKIDTLNKITQTKVLNVLKEMFAE